ncbi:hypothetical protein [Polyangium spumosum]|uniref:Uncharacterized protein n=1 Tax=Polyangium spumosum TaxID=889282 RepID=A0A6N7Q3P5_9BACT|nr:hypothetical protein [Polyangium spumosum]MRG97836.1 hypothetical protein [Polyangium spumosum]
MHDREPMPTDIDQRRLYERPVPRNVFDWLDQVRQRPGMWIQDRSLRELERLVYGYGIALGVHHVDEGVPEMGGHFSSWLRLRKRWSMSLGWAHAITEHSKDQEPLEVFFELIEKYRKLRPATLCYAGLAARHAPTGKRSVVGHDRLLPPPLRIEVVQYKPEPLHFLRFRYPEGHENGSILITGRGEEATTEDDAKRWAEDEFQIDPAEWIGVP